MKKKTVTLLVALFSLLVADAQTAFTSHGCSEINTLHAFSTSDEVADFPVNFSIPNIDSINTNPYALLAGGSKGIGYAIAEALAKRNFNLILIARHKDSLIAAKNKLESLYHVQVEILQYDLSKKEAATEIAAWCTEKNIHLKMLCNVAGFGGSNDFLTLSLDSLRYMVNLNMESCMVLSLTLLPLL